ncbi:MAG: DUF2304 domain-containing protein, partial [Oricola sp.]|nr:DUF2304 domain-containing protein [Oricola sp.]
FFFPWLKAVLLLICVAGLYFVWRPDQLTEIAHLMGVGRGADLIIYSVAIVVLMSAISNNIQGRAQDEKITALVREIAIYNASSGANEKRKSAPMDKAAPSGKGE